MERASSGDAPCFYAARTGRGHAALAAMVLLLGAVPLLLGRPAPLQDWPNHLARVAIVDGLLHGDPFWARFYRLGTFLVPNAALDLGVLALHRLGLPMPVAGQVFLLAIYAAFVTGFCALACALRTWSPEKPALAVMVFYSHALFWGLVNYVLGLGLLMALLAAWLRRGTGGRLVVALAGAVLLLAVHVVPALAFVMLVFCFECASVLRGRTTPRAAVSGLAGLALITAVLRLSPSGTGHDLALDYAGGGSALGFMAWKLRLFATALLGGSVWQDATSGVALLLAALAIAVGRPRRIPIGLGLALTASLALVLLSPERLGTGSLLDERLAILPLLLVAAGLRPAWRGAGRMALAGLLLAVGVRTATLGHAWWAASAVFARYRIASADLPPGGLMMMAYGTRLDTLSWRQIWSPPIQSIATQVVARGLFFPAIFANPAQQPIALRPAFAAIAQPWDLTDATALVDARARLRPLCAADEYPGVFLTVLYPGRFIAGAAGSALLHADPDFLLLDACRLAE